MADAAEEPGPVDATGWGRAVVIPAMGSVLVAGHSPFGALVLRAAQFASLPVPFVGAAPFNCDDADIVDVLEACEDSEDEEFCRCALFLGIKTPPPLGASALHDCRLMVLYETGAWTAVMTTAVVRRKWAWFRVSRL